MKANKIFTYQSIPYWNNKHIKGKSMTFSYLDDKYTTIFGIISIVFLSVALVFTILAAVVN